MATDTISTVTVTLTNYEARALCRAAEFLSGVIGDLGVSLYPLPDGHSIPPLDSARAKLEADLMRVGD